MWEYIPRPNAAESIEMNVATTLFGERRRSPRTSAYFPVELHHDNGEPVTAMARDVSRFGAQLLTMTRIAEATQLAVLMYPTDPDSSVAATGKVVRVAEHREGSLWAWAVSVCFDEPVPGIEPEVSTVAARQRIIGW